MNLRLASTDPAMIMAPNALALGGSYTIGRISGCEFVIKHLSVSREHAKLSVQAQVVTIKDLKSLNGTFVDGVRIQEAQVQPGQTVQFGQVVCYLVGQIASGNQAELDESTAAMPFNEKAIPARRAQLSESQRRVLDFLTEGRTEKEIAAQLRISWHTVHSHVKEIYRCYGVTSRAKLLALFVAGPKRDKKSQK